MMVFQFYKMFYSLLQLFVIGISDLRSEFCDSCCEFLLLFDASVCECDISGFGELVTLGSSTCDALT